jgi:hypothetical protein
MRNTILILVFIFCTQAAAAQNLKVGVTFQYHFAKQVDVDADFIVPAGSYNYYRVIDNRWKFFSAGQSIVIGLVGQLDYKRFYVTAEPSFELCTILYRVAYDLSPSASETVEFKTTVFHWTMPVYVGLQFGSSSLIRYSIFAGGSVSMPFMVNSSLYQVDGPDDNVYDRYSSYDMYNVTYNEKLFFNATAGVAFHYASLFKVDIRLTHRLGSPGSQYGLNYTMLGAGMTYFLPLRLLKQKIYYEE